MERNTQLLKLLKYKIFQKQLQLMLTQILKNEDALEIYLLLFKNSSHFKLSIANYRHVSM